MSSRDRPDTTTGDTAVSLNGVTKIFRQRTRSDTVSGVLKGLFRPNINTIRAVDNVSFTVGCGEILAYAGANGAGKSTTIKLLAGLLSPDSGKISALAMDPVKQRVKFMQRTGVLFGQRTELWWDQPVITSFDWKKVVWNIKDANYRRMKNELVDLLDMAAFLNTHVRELSLGQRMRADMAMALLHEPELLLLDEPTIGMDVLAKRQIIGFLKDMNRKNRMTVIVTSHDMDDLMEIAGRIILLDKGKITYDGSFDRLRTIIGGHRTVILTTKSTTPPLIDGAAYEKSEDNRHWYKVDAEKYPIAAILQKVPAEEIEDVETLRPPFEEQIADLYRSNFVAVR
jgi:ABC-2 type transport system ATP-binding protein